MRLLPLGIAIGVAVLSAAVLAGGPSVLSSEERREGWKFLFDGRSTEAWVAIGKRSFTAKGWTVVDGILHHAHAGGGGDIATADAYENFDLAWDWKIEKGGKSGVRYNLANSAKNVGFEYPLLDDANHPDGQSGGRLHHTGALFDLIEPPADKKLNPPGKWNSSRLLVRGAHVEQWLNGAKTVAFEIGSKDLKERTAKSKFAKVPRFAEKTKSPILLQDHGSEIDFRSIKLRVLDGK